MKLKKCPYILLLSVVFFSVFLIQGCAKKSFKPKLFLKLGDECNTPDAMTMAPDGNIILACPNFVNPEYPGILMKIDKENKAEFYYNMPKDPKTGYACPMGMDFGPDGNLYVADNQYFYDKNYASRLIRVMVKNGKPIGSQVAVDGFMLANAVIWKDGRVYVSDTFLDVPGKPGMSGVWCIKLSEMEKGTVHLKPGLDDPHLIATFTTKSNKRNDLAGADGLTFDSQGRLYTGNFGDGAFSRMTFDRDGNLIENKIISDGKMTCVDGIFCDLSTDKIYIADSENNAIQVYHPDGNITTLWMNGDSDGSDGLLDQPCEPIMRGNELIIVNFDMTFPGLKNTKNDEYHTLSVIKLD